MINFYNKLLNKKEEKHSLNLNEALQNAENNLLWNLNESGSLYLYLNNFQTKQYSNVFYCDYFLIEFSYISTEKYSMTMLYHENFDKFTETEIITPFLCGNKISNMIDRIKISPFIRRKNVIFEKQKYASLFNLLNEACICLKNECFFAFSCVSRNFVLEISKLYKISLFKSEDKNNIDFKNNINALAKHRIFTKKEKNLWNSIIEKCGKIIHYKQKINKNDIKLCCNGIKSLFDLLINYQSHNS